MIRTIDDLIQKISDEIIWRRKELTELKGVVQGAEGSIQSKVLIRAAIALLYAHWEGFVKKSSSYYLEFVASHRLRYSELAPNFVALSIKAKFSELGASKKISGANQLAEFFCSSLSKRSNVPYKGVVDTRSNLTSEVLEDILCSLGISSSNFATKMKYIDLKLVNPRNHIAHGENFRMEPAEYFELHETVVGLIEMYRNEVENASVLKCYSNLSK